MKELDFRTDLLPLKDKLFRLALRILLDSAEAEDTVEDTFVRVWEGRKTAGHIDNLEAYCMTICRNLALDRSAKREAQNVSLDTADHDAPDRSPDAETAMEWQEKADLVKRFFNQLPEKQRMVMHLRDVEEKTTKETAEILCITEEQVKVTLLRARRAIREKIEKLEHYGL